MRISAIVRNTSMAAMAAFCAAPLYGQVTTLRLMPAEGQVSRYVIEAETSVAGSVMATQKIYRTETVSSVAGDVIEIRAVVDSSTSTEAMPGMGGPDLSGMSYTFGVDTRHRVSGLTDAGTLSPDEQAAVNAMLGSSFFELPEGEVSPGDSWSGQVTTELPAAGGAVLTMETAITYTLVSVEGDLAEISLEGTLTMSGNAGGMPMDGTGEVGGTAVFDAGRSRLQSHESVMTVDISAGGMPMSMQTSTTRGLIP